MKINLLIIIASLCCLNVSAQNKSGKLPKFTSVYTDLNTQCKSAFTLKEEKEAEARGQDTPLKCRGFGNYYVYIYYSAEAAIIHINAKNDEEFSVDFGSQNLSYDAEKNRKIEWRLANGKPFAVIARISNYKTPDEMPIGETHFEPKYKTGESLIVKGLQNFERIDAEIDAKTPSANQKARQMADEAFLQKD